MPLKNDPDGGGSEADGTRSQIYCSLCYRDGAFIHQDFTAQDMQEHCVTQLKKRGMPHIMAWMFTRGIPRPGRWKS